MEIRRTYKIGGPIYYSATHPAAAMPPDERIAFYVQKDEISAPIKLNIAGIQISATFQGKEKLIVTGIFPDDPLTKKYLIDENEPKKDAIESVMNTLDIAANRILEIVKYIFTFPPLKEYLKVWMTMELRLPGGTWTPCVDRRGRQWVAGDRILQLDAGTVAEIQGLLDQGVEPLHAMKFLSKAKSEPNLRDRCLLLATAAEQAIKEYFVRVGYHKRNWEDKSIGELYDTELAAASGPGPSPHQAEIVENSRIRNKIVHRPGHDPVITGADTIRLTNAVEKGIWHLMKLLYPGCKAIAELYDQVDNSRPGELEIVE